MNDKKKAGFTLIEVIVAIASSTVILGGFLIAFSSLNKVSRQSDHEVRLQGATANARMMIKKVLDGAAIVDFRTVESQNSCCSGNSYDMLFYYKYETDTATGSEVVNEYGYFYADEQQATDAGYIVKEDASGAAQSRKNLYFQRTKKAADDVNFCATPGSCEPEQFDLKASNRYTVMNDVKDFHGSVSTVEPGVGSDRTRRYNIDYQITAAYDTGTFYGDADGADKAGKEEQRLSLFKGSTYVLGRSTNNG